MIEFINSLRALSIESLLGFYEIAVDNRRKHAEDSDEWEFHKKQELAL